MWGIVHRSDFKWQQFTLDSNQISEEEYEGVKKVTMNLELEDGMHGHNDKHQPSTLEIEVTSFVMLKERARV